MRPNAPASSQAELLRTRLITILQRIVTVEEMRAALELKQSTYYAQVQDERLISLENLRTLARNLDINEVLLFVECGLIDAEALREYCASLDDGPHYPLVTNGLAARIPRPDLSKPTV